ncbi:mannosyltransferase [Flagellimonas sp.]|uniref:mannosyltransferase n=1 Tax=Flagellimonas sp. TaxID=2058762 RepID=UPI003F4A5AA3
MHDAFSKFWNLNRIPLLLCLVSILFYLSFAYDLNREDFPKLLGLYVGLFFLYYKLAQLQQWNFKFLLAVGILFRLGFLFAEPNLSQDFYRFIWDGQLIKNGINPYLYMPNQIMEWSQIPIANYHILFDGMGELSAKHFSNYPPLNQVTFVIAAFLGGKSIMGSIIVLRIQIILADIGIVYFGRKLLQHLKMEPGLIFWYFLNPLVVIELTGNLHFEGTMLFFFVWALYLLIKKQWIAAAPVYAFSILVKLVPILFLPLFLRYLGFKKSVGFYTLVLTTCIAFLAPFYTPIFIDNYSETVGLWFSNFEFNAGIYNVVKSIGVNFFEAKPWELIKSYGKVMAISVIAIALVLTFFRKNENFKTLLQSMLWVLFAYLALSSTVHPWYIIFLLTLSLLTNYKFPILWTLVVILSYWAYSNPDFTENLWLLGIEYLTVFAFLIYELTTKSSKKLDFFKKTSPN